MIELLKQLWSVMSVMEWVAFFTNVICVYLIVKEEDINWPIGVFGSLALIYVFWVSRLYAQVGLQIFYVFECLYGWWKWTARDRATGFKLVRIGRTPFEMAAWLTGIGVVATGLCYGIFARTGDPAPFWDSVIAVGSLIAEYMLCLKWLEAWPLYLGTDLVALVLLAVLGQWVTFGTYLCFTILCLMGIFEWLKRFQNRSVSGSSLASSTL
jgi:nicotinamide mononucleotide transporter